MILLNFTHPITDAQRSQIEALTGRTIERVIERMPHFDDTQPMDQQIRELVAGVGLTSQEWQTEALLINPPGLAPAALCLMAELHGRTGYFPAIVRIRPVAGAIPKQFEVAEIVDIQLHRDISRQKRLQEAQD